VESFLDRILIPKLVSVYPGLRRDNVIFSVDPACYHRSQLNERTIAQAIMARGFRCFPAPTNDPERRIQSVEGLLARQVDGGPGFVFDEENCPHCINSMEWGFRWKKKPEGIVSTEVEKNHWSHIGDGIQYGAMFYNVHGAIGTVFNGRPTVRKIRPVPYMYS